jgi:hypothetical protein
MKDHWQAAELVIGRRVDAGEPGYPSLIMFGLIKSNNPDVAYEYLEGFADESR